MHSVTELTVLYTVIKCLKEDRHMNNASLQHKTLVISAFVYRYFLLRSAILLPLDMLYHMVPVVVHLTNMTYYTSPLNTQDVSYDKAPILWDWRCKWWFHTVTDCIFTSIKPGPYYVTIAKRIFMYIANSVNHHKETRCQVKDVCKPGNLWQFL